MLGRLVVNPIKSSSELELHLPPTWKWKMDEDSLFLEKKGPRSPKAITKKGIFTKDYYSFSRKFAGLSHTIHVWYIYLHLVDFYGKCR